MSGLEAVAALRRTRGTLPDEAAACSSDRPSSSARPIRRCRSPGSMVLTCSRFPVRHASAVRSIVLGRAALQLQLMTVHLLDLLVRGFGSETWSDLPQWDACRARRMQRKGVRKVMGAGDALIAVIVQW